jgi:hypothetical protein
MTIFFASMAHLFPEHASQAVSRESKAALTPLEKRATRAAPDPICPRQHRAQWRLSWTQRLASTARPDTAHPVTVTRHGLSASVAQTSGCDLLPVA